MRRALLLLAILCLSTTGPAASQEPVPWANKFFTGTPDPPPPVILHDFGTLPKGTVKVYRFKMLNIYAVPMQVFEPKPNCGCVSILEYTGKLGPRESGHIDIKLDTSRVEGYKSVSIAVRFEGRDAKTGESFFSYAKLEARVISRQDISMTPGAVEFGVVPVGSKPAQTVDIVYTGRQRDWRILEYSFKKELLDVTVRAVNLRGGVGYRVEAAIRPDAPPGPIDEQIVFKTNDPQQHGSILTLNVTANVQAPFRLRPGDYIKFGGVPVGEKKEANVIVHADKPFKVKVIEGEGEGVTAASVPNEGAKSQVVTIAFTPAKPGPVKRVLTVRTDTGDTIALTVEGIGTEPR